MDACIDDMRPPIAAAATSNTDVEESENLGLRAYKVRQGPGADSSMEGSLIR